MTSPPTCPRTKLNPPVSFFFEALLSRVKRFLKRTTMWTKTTVNCTLAQLVFLRYEAGLWWEMKVITSSCLHRPVRPATNDSRFFLSVASTGCAFFFFIFLCSLRYKRVGSIEQRSTHSMTALSKDFLVQFLLCVDYSVIFWVDVAWNTLLSSGDFDDVIIPLYSNPQLFFSQELHNITFSKTKSEVNNDSLSGNFHCLLSEKLSGSVLVFFLVVTEICTV